MGLTRQDPHIQKEHIELYKILKFRVNWANIEQDTAIQKQCLCVWGVEEQRLFTIYPKNPEILDGM